MPTYRRNRTKPWKARVRMKDGSEMCIGYFKNKEEAECAEYDHGKVIRIKRGRNDDSRET
jgi:hypothetical protein